MVTEKSRVNAHTKNWGKRRPTALGGKITKNFHFLLHLVISSNVLKLHIYYFTYICNYMFYKEGDSVREAQYCICNMILVQFFSKSEKQVSTNNRIL